MAYRINCNRNAVSLRQTVCCLSSYEDVPMVYRTRILTLLKPSTMNQPESSNAYKLSIYPGEYKPLPAKLRLLENKLKDAKPLKASAYNISQTPDNYKIELAAPGFEREDFFIRIKNGGRLVISAMHDEKTSTDEQYEKHAFHHEFLSREIAVPENADTDFSKAEYKNGVLSIWFFKSNGSYKKRESVITL